MSESSSAQTRTQILAVLQQNQPASTPLPSLPEFPVLDPLTLKARFSTVAQAIGAQVELSDNLEEAIARIQTAIQAASLRATPPEPHAASPETISAELQAGQEAVKTIKVISTVPELQEAGYIIPAPGQDPHSYADLDIAIFKPLLGVAENAALWITDEQLLIRALPFITQHIYMLVDASTLVADMHQASQITGNSPQDYGFGTYIAGPSKTADIEQSLVLGAHGPRSMTIFLYG